MPRKQPKKGQENDSAQLIRLNELARLYPWRVFNQSELQLMTGYPREAVSAAFEAPDFPCQFGKSRPETLREWAQAQDAKVQTKEVKK